MRRGALIGRQRLARLAGGFGGASVPQIGRDVGRVGDHAIEGGLQIRGGRAGGRLSHRR